MNKWRRTAVLMLAAALVLAGCGDGGAEPGKKQGQTGASASSKPTGDYTVSAPKPLKKPLLSSDILILSKKSLDRGLATRIDKLKGVESVETFSLGQVFNEETGVTYAAVDPATFRRLTPPGTAQTLDVWKRVASGEIAVSPGIGKRIQDDKGFVRLGTDKDAKEIHIGAFANITSPDINPTTRIDAVVNKQWVKPLHMTPDNAMIVSMGTRAPRELLKELRSITGKGVAVQILGPDLDPNVAQIAIPTGGSVAAAIGSFSYTLNGRTVIPEASWVSENIRTETLPVVGTVRCHKAMLSQLRMVMLEVQRQGLAKHIYDYGGCYVPRYIAGKSTLSNHSFGTAIDLNVQDNLRGVPGKMNRQVVAIFKRFGFGWGGDWKWTDPMHFELSKIVTTGG